MTPDETRKKGMEWMDRAIAAENELADLKSLLTSRDAEIERLKSEIKLYQDGANKAYCTYCGFITEKDAFIQSQHVIECEKRPENVLREALEAAKLDYYDKGFDDCKRAIATFFDLKAAQSDKDDLKIVYESWAELVREIENKPAQPKEDWKRVKGCWNKFEKVTKPPASDTPEKPKDFIEQFRLYFANLARKYPERTLFTEGRDPIQDELVGLHHLAESSDTPARPEWVEKVREALVKIGEGGKEIHLAILNRKDLTNAGKIMLSSAVESLQDQAQEAIALMKRKTEER